MSKLNYMYSEWLILKVLYRSKCKYNPKFHSEWKRLAPFNGIHRTKEHLEYGLPCEILLNTRSSEKVGSFT